MTSTIDLYGIPNCDTVKKSRAWFAAQAWTVRFHDFKKEAPSLELLEAWAQKTDWKRLLNTQGSTWRKLTDDQKAAAQDASSAIRLMLAQPSIIKRPVVIWGTSMTVGFVPEVWRDCMQDCE